MDSQTLLVLYSELSRDEKVAFLELVYEHHFKGKIQHGLNAVVDHVIKPAYVDYVVEPSVDAL